MERCRSGLSSWFRKPVCSLEYRGFESPPLRFYIFRHLFSVSLFDMRNHKRHFVLINMIFLLGLLLTASAFGREYSTETTESATADSAVRAPRPSRPAPAKAAPRAKRSAVTYSTEDIAESPSGTDPTTTGARDHTVYRTKMVPDTPHRPQAPNKPETPEGDGYYGGGYRAVVIRIKVVFSGLTDMRSYPLGRMPYASLTVNWRLKTINSNSKLR